MADKAHRLTDEKLEEMEKRLSAIYSGVEKTVQKKMDDYAKSIDEKSAELLQSYKDAETEDEKRKAKKEYIRFYRQVVKSEEFVSLSANVATFDILPLSFCQNCTIFGIHRLFS